jgi:hypothetical protein
MIGCQNRGIEAHEDQEAGGSIDGHHEDQDPEQRNTGPSQEENHSELTAGGTDGGVGGRILVVGGYGTLPQFGVQTASAPQTAKGATRRCRVDSRPLGSCSGPWRRCRGLCRGRGRADRASVPDAGPESASNQWHKAGPAPPLRGRAPFLVPGRALGTGVYHADVTRQASRGRRFWR